MQGKLRIFLLILILMMIVTAVTWITISTLYSTAFEEESARLTETAQSWARIIESMARFEEQYLSRRFTGDFVSATLDQIRDAHKRFEGFGESGEFTLARRDGDQIVFLLTHRHSDLDNPGPVPIDSHFAEPMRRALNGESGTLVGLDYRGEKVLAAHEPVAVLDLGIVAKIDLREVRAPFVRAGLQAGGMGVALIVLGTLLFLHIGNPMVHSLQKSEERLTLALSSSRLGTWDWNILGNTHTWDDFIHPLFGLEPGTFSGKVEDFISMIHPDDRDRIGKEVEKALADEAEYDTEYRTVWSDGSVHDLAARGRVYRDRHGKPIRMTGVVWDVSARKEAEAEVLKSLEEKELLLREIHHRVKNNLQVISSILNLQRRSENDPKLTAALTSCHNRIATMALSHERIYRSQNLVNIDAGEYVRSIVENLFRVYGFGPDQVVLDLEARDITLDLATANPCGMIINELVSNMLKHAFPDSGKGRITIRLQLEGEEIVLVLADDGIGFPDGVDFRNTDSLGLELVNTFVDQLGGRITQGVGNGTEYRISFDAPGVDS